MRLFAVGLIVLLMGACHYWAGGAFYYYADPIRAKVIDEETGLPVGGVVAVAIWNPMVLLLAHNQIAVHAAEAITNAQGEFFIPGWGPKLRVPLTELDYLDPEIHLYKPGYHIGRFDNDPAYVRVTTFWRNGRKFGESPVTLHPGQVKMMNRYSRKAKRFCYWNGKTMPMTKAATVNGRVEAYQETLSKCDSFEEVLTPSRFPLLWKTIEAGWRGFPDEVRPSVSAPKPYKTRWGMK